MGHIRLGNLHKTRRWTQVIEMLDAGAGANAIASGALDASENAFWRQVMIWFQVHCLAPNTGRPRGKEGEFPRRTRQNRSGCTPKTGLFDILGAFTRHVALTSGQREDPHRHFRDVPIGCGRGLGREVYRTEQEPLRDDIRHRSEGVQRAVHGE